MDVVLRVSWGKGFRGDLMPSDRKRLGCSCSPSCLPVPRPTFPTSVGRGQCFGVKAIWPWNPDLSVSIHFPNGGTTGMYHQARVMWCWGLNLCMLSRYSYQLSYTSSKARVFDGIPQWVSFSISHKFDSYVFSTYYLPSKLSHTSPTAKWILGGIPFIQTWMNSPPKMTTQVYTTISRTNIERLSPRWVLF